MHTQERTRVRVQAEGNVQKVQKTRPPQRRAPSPPMIKKGDIDFPQFVDLQLRGTLTPWAWAKRFVDLLKTAGFKLPPERRVRMFSEFSGSSCPEAAAQSIAHELGPSLSFVSAADLDPQCRKVIMHTRQGPGLF